MNYFSLYSPSVKNHKKTLYEIAFRLIRLLHKVLIGFFFKDVVKHPFPLGHMLLVVFLKIKCGIKT